MILTYKYRLKDRSARKTLRRHAGAANQVWNYCNAVQRDIESRHRAGAPKRKWPSHFDLQKLTAGAAKKVRLLMRTPGGEFRLVLQTRKRGKGSRRVPAARGPPACALPGPRRDAR